MPLRSGDRLGPYEVRSRLGAAGLHLVSPDGSDKHTLQTSSRPFAFSKDGSELCMMRRQDSRRELVRVAIPDGTLKRAVTINLPNDTGTGQLSLHPDGKRLAASIQRDAHDIWILDGFEPPRSLFSRWWPRK